MLNQDTLIEALASLALKNAPLTTVAAGKYPQAHVDQFVNAVKGMKSKQYNDMVRTFVSGKASHKRCIWVRSFRQMACEHFAVHNFTDFFTKEGREGQSIAMELHRQRARRFEIAKKSPKAAREIAVKIQQLYTIARIYNATLTQTPRGMKVSMPSPNGKIVFSVSEKGASDA